MSDRAEEIAKEVSRQVYVEGVPLGTAVSLMVSALRAYAEAVRREEREVAAKDAQMRYEDGYAAQAALERVGSERQFLVAAFKEKTADFAGEMERHRETAQRFTARIARLEAALLNLVTYGRKCWCPVGYHPVEVHHQRCRYIRAALEGRDE